MVARRRVDNGSRNVLAVPPADGRVLIDRQKVMVVSGTVAAAQITVSGQRGRAQTMLPAMSRVGRSTSALPELPRSARRCVARATWSSAAAAGPGGLTWSEFGRPMRMREGNEPRARPRSAGSSRAGAAEEQGVLHHCGTGHANGQADRSHPAIRCQADRSRQPGGSQAIAGPGNAPDRPKAPVLRVRTAVASRPQRTRSVDVPRGTSERRRPSPLRPSGPGWPAPRVRRTSTRGRTPTPTAPAARGTSR